MADWTYILQEAHKKQCIKQRLVNHQIDNYKDWIIKVESLSTYIRDNANDYAELLMNAYMNDASAEQIVINIINEED